MKPIVDAVLLDGRQDVASALAKILRSRLDRIAVRRTKGLEVFWYLLDRKDVLAEFAHFSADCSVERALDLHEYMAVRVPPVSSTAAIAASDVNEDTIALDGATFVGVRLANVPPEPGLPGLSRADPVRASLSGEFTAEHQEDEEDEEEDDKALFPGLPTATAPSSSFSAYPRVEAPGSVEPREQFDVTIGLAPQSTPGTKGEPFTIDVPTPAKQFTLAVQVVADGFEMPAGSLHRLVVNRDSPFEPLIQVPLIAPNVDEVRLTTITVVYFFEGAPCGVAARRIAVIPAGTQPSSRPPGTGRLWTEGATRDGPVALRGVAGVDLTVIISKPDGNPTNGDFVWSFYSPHAVALPRGPFRPRSLGLESREFGAHVIDAVTKAEAGNSLEHDFRGLCQDIAWAIQPEFWPLLRDVAKAVRTSRPGQTPTVLFLTAESHVPWELALVDPPLDPDAPPYLGCQVDVARWPLSDDARPPCPPASEIDVRELAVVIGDYAGRSQWKKLERAEDEGKVLLGGEFRAIQVDSEPQGIARLLDARLPGKTGPTGAEVVHFACHGEAVGGHALDAAIILGDDRSLSPNSFASTRLGKEFHPFLFLNACQVGQAGDLLGSFSGFAGESLKGGFGAFLAPLWSVYDPLAHDIALEFYRRALGVGGKPPEPVATILRDLRRRYAPDTEPRSITRLAYAYYGHPGLRLRRT